MEIDELLETAKDRANLKSDYALAKALGIQNGIVANWRKGKRHPSTEEAVQLATLAGLDEMRVIAEIERRTAKTEEKRKFWTLYIQSKGLTACLTMAVLAVIITATPEKAEASILHLQNYDVLERTENNPNIHYANFRYALKRIEKLPITMQHIIMRLFLKRSTHCGHTLLFVTRKHKTGGD